MLADNLRSAFNVGGLFRTLDAAGGQTLHLTGYTARPAHPRVARAAMGADTLVSSMSWADPRHAVGWLLERGFHLVGLEPSPDATDFRHYQYQWPLCVVVGNEASGISPAVLRRLHGTVRIPMHGGKSSLNVVVALGIVLFRVADRPVRPRPGEAPHRRDSSAFLAAVAERIRASDGHHGAWQWCTRGMGTRPEIVVLIHAPQFPSFRAWGCAESGGALLMFTPGVSVVDCSPGHGDSWVPMVPGPPVLASVPEQLMPDHAPRGLAFAVEVELVRACATPGMVRLWLDRLVGDLLRRKDLAASAATPYLTRFLGAEDPAELLPMAERLIDRLLRPMGGRWVPGELIYDPECIGLKDDVDDYVRTLVGLS